MADPKRADPQNRLRDNRALTRFELFLFAAVATVLLVRTFLAVSGYPQVGGGGLHIAHVLWGGLLMLGWPFRSLARPAPGTGEWRVIGDTSRRSVLRRRVMFMDQAP